MTNTIINVQNLSFSYNRRKVLDKASFSIQEGAFLGIVGPNGAGKSTLLKLMLGLLTPDEGEIKINGVSVRPQNGGSASRIAYVSQRALSFNADFPATAGEIVSLGLYDGFRLRLRHSSASNTRQVAAALDKVGLGWAADKRIGRLSGGEQQRVFIARALAADPRILFLDEPTVGIDFDAMESISCLLGELNSAYGITVLMVTHDLAAILGHASAILNFRKNGGVELLPAAEYASILRHDHAHEHHRH